MTPKQAVRLAVEAIDREIKGLALTANAFEYHGMEFGRVPWEKRQKLREARAVLLSMLDQKGEK